MGGGGEALMLLMERRDSMRKIAIVLAATAAFCVPASLAAQDAAASVTEAAPAGDGASAPSQEEAEMAAIAGMMAGAFKAEPLTEEQQARLPQAEAIINRLIPDGAMAEMSKQMFGSILGPLEGLMPSGAKPVAAEYLGVGPAELDGLSEEQAAEVATLFDPAWKEREAITKSLIPEMLSEVMTLMEPGMRKAMSELYAIRFTSAELTDIGGFFATETGTKYARESFSMTSDPRIMSASMEMMPALFGMLGSMEQRMKERMADMSPARSFTDLGAKERARVAELSGYTVEEIESNLAGRAVTIPEVPPAE